MCSTGNLKQVLRKTKEELAAVFGDGLLDVLLYGSYARGDQDAESDIDVLALVNLSREELTAYRRRISDFSSRMDLEYDVLLSIKLQDAETFYRYGQTLPFFQNVQKEGIRVVQ